MNTTQLNILWTNDNPITSELMVLMYATATMKKKRWENVTVIIWGATARLVAEDVHIQALIAEAREAGVFFTACQACVDRLGLNEDFLRLGIDVQYWGDPLTKLIKDKENLITI